MCVPVETQPPKLHPPNSSTNTSDSQDQSAALAAGDKNGAATPTEENECQVFFLQSSVTNEEISVEKYSGEGQGAAEVEK